MHGSIKAGGKVAKWASLNGWVLTVQTDLADGDDHHRERALDAQAVAEFAPVYSSQRVHDPLPVALHESSIFQSFGQFGQDM